MNSQRGFFELFRELGGSIEKSGRNHNSRAKIHGKVIDERRFETWSDTEINGNQMYIEKQPGER